MKFIEDYRDHYKNKKFWKNEEQYKKREIWITGGGSSLDDFPCSFFKDKIFIALSYSIVIFPDFASRSHCYIHAGDLSLPAFLKQYRPDLLKKCIFLYPIFPGYYPKWFGQYQADPIYMRFNCRYGNLEEYKNIAKCIMEKKQCYYQVEATCAHSAIQAAIILGAKKVTLVGCEARCSKYKAHAQKRGMWLFNKETGREYSEIEQRGETPTFKRFKNGTLWLAQAFKPYGVEIMRYFYDRGYEKIA